MEFKLKLVVVAVLALLAGTAFAAPMLVVDIRPFPRIPEGPKANFELNIVYANFNAIKVNATEREIAYTVVANITNLSDKVGYLYETGFVAAQHLVQSDSALGGMYLDSYFNDLPFALTPGRGGLVDGIYLDGNWLNKTWIPGTDYPDNLVSVINDENSDEHTALPAIPALPENASGTGIWIEGVPIAEHYGGTGITTHIYVNGSWVDVTGRVQPHNPQPFVLSSNTIADLTLTPSVGIYGASNTGTTIPLMGWQSGMLHAYQYIGGRGFDRTWLPYQSRLLIFNGTVTLSNDDFNNRIAEILENGIVDIYGSVTSYINDWPVDDTFSNTVYTSTAIKTVTLQKTQNGYLYNTALAPDQYFQVCPDGVQVYIKQVGE